MDAFQKPYNLIMFTRILFRFVIFILLGMMPHAPAYAQKFPKAPKPGAVTSTSTKAAKALNPAHQAALLHVQRIRELSILKKKQALETAIAASKTQIIQPSVIEKAVIQKTLEQSPVLPEPVPPMPITPEETLQPELEPEEIELAQGEPEEIKPTLDDKVEDIDLQLKLLDLEKRIQALQEEQIRKLDENPLWKRTLDSFPPRKTPEMWMRVFEDYVLQYRKFPKNSGDTSVLYHAYLRIQKKFTARHPVVKYLQTLRRQYPPEIATPKLPEQWLVELKDFTAKNGRFPRKSSEDPAEIALHKGIYNAIARLGPEDPISQEIHSILEQYPNTYKSPQEWAEKLESFITQYNRFPNRTAKDTEERALAVGVHHVLRQLDPQNPISMRIRSLHAPFAVHHNTPQDWLNKLEDFVQQNNRFPSYYSNDPTERILNKGLYNVLQKKPADPAVLRIRFIQQQFSPVTTQLLNRLQKFIDKYGYFPEPSLNGQEDKLYWDIIKLMEKLPENSPIVASISRLKYKYKKD